MNASNLHYDCLGIGIGPSNLSLACLLDPIKKLNYCFLEQKPTFIWHEGLLLEDASVQISILKDLVSLVNPRSEYSFLSFLHEKNRLYHFINADFTRAKRTEFNQYFQWACSKLKYLKFSHKVKGVAFNGDFQIETEQGLFQAKNIVIGVGQVPHIPPFAKKVNHPTVFHASELLTKQWALKDKRIAVIGGGQSGAEVFSTILSSPKIEAPSKCLWMSRRSNFFPLDESPFCNEFFMPIYSEYFNKLPDRIKKHKLKEQNLINNGISLDTIRHIYQAIYQNAFLSKKPISIKLLAGREALDIDARGNSWKLTAKHMDTGEYEAFEADIIVLATGYRYEIPNFLSPIRSRLQIQDEELVIRDDFSARWDGPDHHRIYIQNNAIGQKGIADPNLSLIAWRSAKIINSLMNQQVYKDQNIQSFISWGEDLRKKIAQFLSICPAV